MGKDGLKYLFGILLLVLIAGVSLNAIIKANSTQNEKTAVMEEKVSSVWDEIGN